MTTPPTGTPAEVPEPEFVALMRRLGMGTLTFDVPRMGQQGYVPVSEFLDSLDAWINAQVEARVEPRLVEQVEAQIAERIEAAIAERSPAIVEAYLAQQIADMASQWKPVEPDDDRTRPSKIDGLVRVSFWSNVEERIVVRYVESLDAELTEWDEDCADPNEDAPLWSADILIAFDPDVSDERLAVLTGWAQDLLMEDVVAYAGPPHFTTPRLTAEGQEVFVHDGIEAILDMAASETRPRESILPPAETDPTMTGSPGFGPVMVAFYDDSTDVDIVSGVYPSLDATDPRFQHGEIAFADADPIVFFGDVSTKDLLALTGWAHDLAEENLIGVGGLTKPEHAIDGIQGVIDYMVDRTGDPASDFAPPTLPSAESAKHATDGLIAAFASVEPGSTPIPREGIFGDMASVMAELGMPEEMIATLLGEEGDGFDLFARMAGIPRDPGRVMASYWSIEHEQYVVREVEGLEVEFYDYAAGDQTLSDANTVLAFGDVDASRLLQLTVWASQSLGGDLDLVGYAGPTSMVNTAVDGIAHVLRESNETAPPAPGPVHDDTPLEGDRFEIDAASLTAALLSLRLDAVVTVRDGSAEVTFSHFQRVFSVQAAGNKMAVVSHQTGVRDFSETTNAVPVTHDTIAAALWSSVGTEEGAFEHDGPFPPLPAYTPIEAGPLSTDPFAVIMTDPGDWPYNDAYISSDASLLHRIEHDRSMPRDEVLQEVVNEMTSIIKTATSESNWWAQVTKSLDELGIPDERRFEGIFY